MWVIEEHWGGRWQPVTLSVGHLRHGAAVQIGYPTKKIAAQELKWWLEGPGDKTHRIRKYSPQ